MRHYLLINRQANQSLQHISLFTALRRSSQNEQTAMLQHRITELEEMLLKRDSMIRSLLLSSANSDTTTAAGSLPTTSTAMKTPQTHAAAADVDRFTPQYTRVSNDEELERAFKNRAPFIALAEGRRYVLLPQPCHVREASIVLFGKAEIEGSLKLSNCTLDATDVTFISPERHLPVIDATGPKSRVRLTACSLRKGRDGLYLSNGASGTLRQCDVRDNVRGVFEGLGCRLSVGSSYFCGNWFHAVLLTNPKHERALEFFPEEPLDTEKKKDANVADKAHPDTRADVVFQYNPMEDRYNDVFFNGLPVVLTDEHSTANLCDATW